MTRHRLAELLGRFAHLKIAVVGDFFVDRYLIIDPGLAERSIETGLEAHQVVEVRAQPGAAGTVTSNLAALGVGDLFAVGFTGRDGEGFELREGLASAGVRLDFLFETDARRTPTYTKPLVSEPGGPRELNRLDIKNRRPLPADLEYRLVECVRGLAAEADAVIIADQVTEPDCGVITAAMREALAELGRRSCHAILWADSRAHIGAFRDVIVKPNLDEAAAVLRAEGLPVETTQVHQLGRELARRNGRPAFITLGVDGALIAEERDVVHVPGVSVPPPIDIVGAGDSFTAGAASALAAGASLREAGEIGCLVASITVQQIGTTGTASPARVLERWAESPFAE